MLNIQGFAPSAAMILLLDGFLAAEDPVSITVHLYKNDVVPSQASVLGDFVEADFDGYGDKSIVAADYPSPHLMPDGSVVEIFDSNLTWNDTGSLTPNTVYGIFITDHTNGILLAGMRFDTPKLMDANLKFITLELALQLIPAALQTLGDVTSNA